jgi:hypothetical protein
LLILSFYICLDFPMSLFSQSLPTRMLCPYLNKGTGRWMDGWKEREMRLIKRILNMDLFPLEFYR